MIFDSLTHVTPDGRWFGTKLDASEAELLRQLDATGTEHAMVVALADHIENRFVLRVCQHHPERLLPCASFNPSAHGNPDEVRRKLREELKDSPYKALKLHPRLNRYDPLDPRCLAILEEISDWKSPVPIWLDTLFYYQGGQLTKPPVDTIHHLVGRFPAVPFILLHGGGSQILQVAEAVRDCPNAFLDLSFTLHRYRASSIEADLRYLVDTFDRRLVFGSDFPEVSVSTALQDFQELADGLPSEKCARVLGGNLNRILNMEQS